MSDFLDLFAREIRWRLGCTDEENACYTEVQDRGMAVETVVFTHEHFPAYGPDHTYELKITFEGNSLRGVFCSLDGEPYEVCAMTFKNLVEASKDAKFKMEAADAD